MPEPHPLLIRSLLNPAVWPEPCDQVGIVETHASWVLLTDSHAYKIKKPIVLPFLDYGTLERREAFCRKELELNRRFAPSLYLDVVAICGLPNQPHFDGGGKPIEYAVKMNRFEESQRLDHLCKAGALKKEHVGALAATMASAHDQAEVAPEASRFGEPAQVVAPAFENFEELVVLLPSPPLHERLVRLQRWTRDQARQLAPHFAERKAAGKVRACHGDLHLGNLVLLEGRVTPFDCIEFNEDFRWIDVASEIAFTYVDLLDHRQPGLATWLLNEWLTWSGEFGALNIFRFYAVYRALVRAKVAGIRGDLAEAVDYLAMAERLVAPPVPRLTITHGVSGSGKTTTSTQYLLADASANLVRLRSDVERKRLFGLGALAASGSQINGGIYHPDATRRTYARLLELVDRTLNNGWSVIVDAAFLRRAERDDFAELAKRHRVDFAIQACDAPVDTLRQRVSERRNDASEAGIEVLARQLEFVEALGEDELVFRVSSPAPDSSNADSGDPAADC